MKCRCANLKAPAKINLALYIVGRRPDGYHDLVTVFQRLDLCDEVSVECFEGADIQVLCPDGGAPEGERNLAHKAVTIFLQKTGHSTGVRVIIKKRIPAGAGLGGGSSDAASTLLGLNRVCNFPLERGELASLGAGIGADVPFFVWELPSAVGKGIGDRIERFDAPSGVYLLLNPKFTVSTGRVYSRLKLKLTRSDENSIQKTLNEKSCEIPALLHNDLEMVTGSEFPVIEEMKSRLMEMGSEGAMMSGSGPTVFGYFRDPECAAHAFERLQTESRWSSFLTHSF